MLIDYNEDIEHWDIVSDQYREQYDLFNDNQKEFFKNIVRSRELELVYTMFDKEFNEAYTLFELEEFYNSPLITVMVEEKTKILTMRFDAFYIYPYIKRQIFEEDILKEKEELNKIIGNGESKKRGRL